MTAPVNPVEAVRERLGENGEQWYKGDLRDPLDESRVCIIGAIRDEIPELCSGVELAVQRVVEEQYPDRTPDDELAPVAAFNDHPATTWADVDLVLDKAARRWDEQS